MVGMQSINLLGLTTFTKIKQSVRHSMKTLYYLVHVVPDAL